MEKSEKNNPDLLLTTAPSNSSPSFWQYARDRGDEIALRAEARRQQLRLRLQRKYRERRLFRDALTNSPTIRFTKYMFRLMEQNDDDPRAHAARAAMHTKLWQRIIDPRTTRNKPLI